MKKFTLLLFSLLLAACSSGVSLTGTWEAKGGNRFRFESNGTITGLGNENNKDGSTYDAGTYSVDGDTVTIKGKTYQKAEDRQQALDNSGYYYVNGNTLIYGKQEYVKQ